MANLLFLAHRLPYPPNKGDKVRSFHLLQMLAENHRVSVGTFVDDIADVPHVATLARFCANLHAEPLRPSLARVSSLAGLIMGEPLTEIYYRSKRLARWVEATLVQERIDAIVVFSSSMVQYAAVHPSVPMLLDFVDVDSAKWAAYAPKHRWPLSWLYGREGRLLLAGERRAAASARHAFFATEKEAELFRTLAPESRGRVSGMDNGVDAGYFAADQSRISPYDDGETPIVFTGAMDYWPNVDAVTWFATHVLPRLRKDRPKLRFHVVGRSPSAAVRSLVSEGVVVSGTVPDVRPYIEHAAVVVAPLRLARGIQNKILEAMAVGRPVVAATACVEAMRVTPGRDILAAHEADEYVQHISGLLNDPARAVAIGAAGRRRVLEAYSWSANLKLLERHLQDTLRDAAALARSRVTVHVHMGA